MQKDRIAVGRPTQAQRPTANKNDYFARENITYILC